MSGRGVDLAAIVRRTRERAQGAEPEPAERAEERAAGEDIPVDLCPRCRSMWWPCACGPVRVTRDR